MERSAAARFGFHRRAVFVDDTPVAPKARPNANEIVIGHYASMTGSEATFGRSTDNGIKLAIDEINAAGGVNGKKVRAHYVRRQGRSTARRARP